MSGASRSRSDQGGTPNQDALAGRSPEDDEFEDLVEDATEEARKFGNLVKVVIPRPSPGSNPAVAGVGKAFLEYACLDSSSHCRRSMDRRWFAGRRIAAGFYPEDMFAAGDYGYDVDCPEDDG